MIMGANSPKKIGALIIDSMKPGDNNASNFEKMAKEPESDIDDGVIACAEEMLMAIKRDDVKAFAESLVSFYEIMEMHEESETPEEESAEHESEY